MKKSLLLLLGIIHTIPAIARDFDYTYEGQTITYTVIDELAKTCKTKDGDSYSSGNKVSDCLILPAHPIDGDVEFTLIKIGDSSFYFCENLTSITIPNSVISIDVYAFSGCSKLTSITIPNSVTEICTGAFMGCRGLTSVIFGNSVSLIGDTAFNNCTSLTSVSIPGSVKTIGYRAFARCRNMTSVEIPASVSEIGSQVFFESKGLTSITYDSKTPIGCDSDIFDDEVYQSAELIIPKETLATFQATEPWNKFLKITEQDLGGIENIVADTCDSIDYDATYEIYNISGADLGNSPDRLPRGIYIIRQGNKVMKLKI